MVQVTDNLREALLCLLVQVRDSDTSSQDSVVRMFGCKICSGLSSEILQSSTSETGYDGDIDSTHIEFNGCYTLVHSRYDFLRDPTRPR